MRKRYNLTQLSKYTFYLGRTFPGIVACNERSHDLFATGKTDDKINVVVPERDYGELAEGLITA